MGLLNSFNFPKVDYNRNDNVELGSALFLELWRHPKGYDYVKVVYRRSADQLFDLSNELEGCRGRPGEGCAVAAFLRRTQRFVLDPAEQFDFAKVSGNDISVYINVEIFFFR